MQPRVSKTSRPTAKRPNRPKNRLSQNSEFNYFIDYFLKEIESNNAAIFAGAGLSRAAGYVDWVGLLTPIAASIGLDAHKEHDLVTLAQFHLNENANNRHQINQVLISEFSDIREPTELHTLLSRLPINTFWTTNYDRMIENAIIASGKRVDVKYTIKHLATTKRGRDVIIYKMHGDIEHPSDAVLTKDDYEKYHRTHAPFITALSGDLVERTFLFIGFSFSDPNLDYVLSRIRTTFDGSQRQHYCIMKKRAKNAGESDKDYRYAVTKQHLQTQDLTRFNIKTIFVDSYQDINDIIKSILNKYRRKTVFISGSAHNYGTWGRNLTEEFLTNLSSRLISNDYRIASGFGLGIGGAIVNGATSEIYSSNNRSIDEQLILRPFPTGISNPNERRKVFSRYREELMMQAGIAIFIMGNKYSDGITIDAEGLKEEFDIAARLGLKVIPIGASGFAAEALHKQVVEDTRRFFPDAPAKVISLLKRIGKPTSDPTALVNPILELVSALSKE